MFEEDRNGSKKQLYKWQLSNVEKTKAVDTPGKHITCLQASNIARYNYNNYQL